MKVVAIVLCQCRFVACGMLRTDRKEKLGKEIKKVVEGVRWRFPLVRVKRRMSETASEGKGSCTVG
jgi:hypothetical protein